MNEILITVTSTEMRVALVENSMLQEIYIERAQKRGVVGNIYRGKVMRVMPGMQAAFVNIGLEKSAFIHTADRVEASNDTLNRSLPHEGKTITVQVMKEPISTKGARLTNQLSLSSCYVVYTPMNNHIGVSQRIADEVERERLRLSVQQAAAEQKMEGGFIVRTAAEGVSDADIQNDVYFLKKQWDQVKAREQQASSPSLIYEELPLYLRILRDRVRENVDKIIIDNESTFNQAILFADNFMPSIKYKVEYYDKEKPLFTIYNIEEEIQKALKRKVELTSGGYLMIDQTESMTTIDVNTGAFVGSLTHEETIFKTNVEAVTSIVRQLRIRNIGGIIIDFIDMEILKHRHQVLQLLEKALEKDNANTKMAGVSELGLVEMTRKRTRESLSQLLCEACSTCHGKAIMKTAETVCYEIMREVMRLSKTCESCQCRVVAAQVVVDRFLENGAGYLVDLEHAVGSTISFQVEPMYMQDQYDVILS